MRVQPKSCNKEQDSPTFEHLQKHFLPQSLDSLFEPVSFSSLPRKSVTTSPRQLATGRAWGSPWSWPSKTDRQLYVSKGHKRFLIWVWSDICVDSMLWFQIEVVPSASALIIKALKEPPRDRKKVKNSKWHWVQILYFILQLTTEGEQNCLNFTFHSFS